MVSSIPTRQGWLSRISYEKRYFSYSPGVNPGPDPPPPHSKYFRVMSYSGSSKANRSSLKAILEKRKEATAAGSVVAVESKDETWMVMPVFPAVKDITDQQFQARLADHPAFRPTKPVKITVKGGETAWSHNFAETLVGMDKRPYAAAVTYYKYLRDKKASPEKLEVLKAGILNIQNTVSSNGKLVGLLTRLITSFPRKEPKMEVDKGAFMYAIGSLPFVFVKKIPERPDFFDEDVFDITESADAGCPFVITDRGAKCTGQVLEDALALSEKYIAILDKEDGEKEFTKYRSDHPDEFLWLMKRKHERLSRAKAVTKVRPYYVPPLAMKLLYLWVAHYLQESLVPYTKLTTSNSAYKTSWFYKGASNFIEGWLHRNVREAMADGKFRFCAVSFGDDNTWLFAWPDGTFAVLGPDVNAMDMNVPTSVGKLLYKNVDLHYTKEFDQGLPKLYSKIFKQLLHEAFVTNIHACGPYNFLIQWGLRSGIPLTTLLDMMFSGVIQGLVNELAEEAFSGSPSYSESEFTIFLERVVKVVKAKTGATFKTGTLKPYTYSNFDAKEYNFSFLGVTFKLVDLGPTVLNREGGMLVSWVPIPLDLSAYFASMALPNRKINKGLEFVNYLERMYGLYLSGAWATELGPLIEKEYKEILNLEHKPRHIDCIVTGMEEMEELFDAALSTTPQLPSKEVILSMYGEGRDETADRLAIWLKQFNAAIAASVEPDQDEIANAADDFGFLTLNERSSGIHFSDPKHIGSVKVKGPPKPARPGKPKKQAYKKKTAPEKKATEDDLFADFVEDENPHQHQEAEEDEGAQWSSEEDEYEDDFEMDEGDHYGDHDVSEITGLGF